jgi:putative heme-binding domain-containing protein
LHNPYTYGYFDHVKQHDPRGGHVVDGGLVYQGDGFPASFRGKYIAANLLSHDVYYSSIMPKGSSFESQHAGELLLSNDTWFAPSDVAMGPDGSIYVTDWHDQRTAHPDPDAEWDRRNGRIYRIKADGTRPVGKLNLGAAPSDKLVEYLSHPNDWFARKARVELAARRDASVIATLKKTVRSSRDEHRVLQSLWALYVSGGFDESLARELCGNPSAAVRAWAVRLVGDARNVSRETAKRLIALAENDPSLRVRSQLASTAKRLPPADGLPICERILMRNEDGMDLHIPLLLWWAIEHHALNDVDGVLDRFASAEAWRAPMIREHILDRLTRRYAAEESDAGFAACARILESAPTAKDRLAMVAALGKGLKSSRLDRVPRALVTPIAALRKAHRSDVSVIRTAARLGSRSAYEQAVAWLSDEGSSVSTQVAMLGVLGDVYQPACIPVVLERIGNGAPEAVQLAALGALRRFDDPRILSALLARYSAMPAKARSAARDMFFGRRGWASAFLERLDAGAFDPKEVPADQLRQLAVHEDEELDAQVRKHWGRISRPSAGEKLAEVRRLNNDVRAKPGDPVKGHALYKARCAVCHRLYGEGNNVGPDLTQANRKDRNFLLVTLIDPSLTIRKEYTSYIVQTTDGRFLTGLIIEQTPSSITLAGNNDTRTTIARDAVEAMKESPISLMPEGLLKDLSPDQLRDLFAYLESDQPPAGVELIPGDLP